MNGGDPTGRGAQAGAGAAGFDPDDGEQGGLRPLPLGLAAGRPAGPDGGGAGVGPGGRPAIGGLARGARGFASCIGLGFTARRAALARAGVATDGLAVRPPVDFWPGGADDPHPLDRVRTGDPAYDRLVNQRRAAAAASGRSPADGSDRIGRGLPASIHRRGRTIAGPRTAPGAGGMRPGEIRPAPNEATRLAPSATSSVPAPVARSTVPASAPGRASSGARPRAASGQPTGGRPTPSNGNSGSGRHDRSGGRSTADDPGGADADLDAIRAAIAARRQPAGAEPSRPSPSPDAGAGTGTGSRPGTERRPGPDPLGARPPDATVGPSVDDISSATAPAVPSHLVVGDGRPPAGASGSERPAPPASSRSAPPDAAAADASPAPPRRPVAGRSPADADDGGHGAVSGVDLSIDATGVSAPNTTSRRPSDVEPIGPEAAPAADNGTGPGTASAAAGRPVRFAGLVTVEAQPGRVPDAGSSTPLIAGPADPGAEGRSRVETPTASTGPARPGSPSAPGRAPGQSEAAATAPVRSAADGLPVRGTALPATSADPQPDTRPGHQPLAHTTNGDRHDQKTTDARPGQRLPAHTTTGDRHDQKITDARPGQRLPAHTTAGDRHDHKVNDRRVAGDHVVASSAGDRGDAGRSDSTTRPGGTAVGGVGAEGGIRRSETANAEGGQDRSADDPGERFLSALRSGRPDRPVPLPGRFRPLARALTGGATVRLVTGPATRRALDVVGSAAATIGRTVYLGEAPGSTPTQHGILAHELVHAAHPSPLPRFFADPRPSAEERLAHDTGHRVAAGLPLPAAPVGAGLPLATAQNGPAGHSRAATPGAAGRPTVDDAGPSSPLVVAPISAGRPAAAVSPQTARTATDPSSRTHRTAGMQAPPIGRMPGAIRAIAATALHSPLRPAAHTTPAGRSPIGAGFGPGGASIDASPTWRTPARPGGAQPIVPPPRTGTGPNARTAGLSISAPLMRSTAPAGTSLDTRSVDTAAISAPLMRSIGRAGAGPDARSTGPSDSPPPVWTTRAPGGGTFTAASASRGGASRGARWTGAALERRGEGHGGGSPQRPAVALGLRRAAASLDSSTAWASGDVDTGAPGPSGAGFTVPGARPSSAAPGARAGSAGSAGTAPGTLDLRRSLAPVGATSVGGTVEPGARNSRLGSNRGRETSGFRGFRDADRTGGAVFGGGGTRPGTAGLPVGGLSNVVGPTRPEAATAGPAGSDATVRRHVTRRKDAPHRAGDPTPGALAAAGGGGSPTATATPSSSGQTLDLTGGSAGTPPPTGSGGGGGGGGGGDTGGPTAATAATAEPAAPPPPTTSAFDDFDRLVELLEERLLAELERRGARFRGGPF